MADIIIHEDAIRALVNNPAGGIAGELVRQAETIRDQIKTRLDVERPAGTEDEVLPGNVPYRRTGRLRDSIKVTEAAEIEGTIAVGVWADKAEAPHADVYLNRASPSRGAPREWRIVPDHLIDS